MYREETIELMEPMLPAEDRLPEDLVFTLTQQTSELKAVLKPHTAQAIPTSPYLLSTLSKEGLLTSDTPKGSARIAFPLKLAERIFPSLYPT